MLSAPCKVSVIVAAYNAAADISLCLESVIAQTLTDWEIIVVDDRSTDDTVAVVRAYVARDARITLIEMPLNGGPSPARNRGLDAARGTWVAILDSDDIFVPDRLERMVRQAEQAGSDIVSDNPVLVTRSTGLQEPMFTGKLMETAHRIGLEEFILGNIGTPDKPRVASGFMKPIMSTAFLKRHAIRYDEQMRFSEDFVFYVTCLQRSARWDYIPDLMYHYTVREASLSGHAVTQQPRELRRLFDFSRELMNTPGAQADQGLKRASLLHYRKVRRWYSYRSIVEAAKTRQWRHAASILYRTPDAIGGVVSEALVQAPALGRKVLRKLPFLSAS